MSYAYCYANSTSPYCNFRITSFSTSAAYCVTCDEPSLDMVVTESHMNGGSMYLALNAHSLKALTSLNLFPRSIFCFNSSYVLRSLTTFNPDQYSDRYQKVTNLA